MIRHSKGGYWCAFERREGAVPPPAPTAPPALAPMPLLKAEDMKKLQQNPN